MRSAAKRSGGAERAVDIEDLLCHFEGKTESSSAATGYHEHTSWRTWTFGQWSPRRCDAWAGSVVIHVMNLIPNSAECPHCRAKRPDVANSYGAFRCEKCGESWSECSTADRDDDRRNPGLDDRRRASRTDRRRHEEPAPTALLEPRRSR
jgi:hypothetical protein